MNLAVMEGGGRSVLRGHVVMPRHHQPFLSISVVRLTAEGNRCMSCGRGQREPPPCRFCSSFHINHSTGRELKTDSDCHYPLRAGALKKLLASTSPNNILLWSLSYKHAHSISILTLCWLSFSGFCQTPANRVPLASTWRWESLAKQSVSNAICLCVVLHWEIDCQGVYGREDENREHF